MSVAPVSWIAEYAARGGLRYEPEADERWLRVWEPYATLVTPVRYEHALHASGPTGAVTIARIVLSPVHARAPGAPEPMGPEAWIVVGQDERLAAAATGAAGGRVSAVSDRGSPFAEPLDLVPLPRRTTGDATFDHVFATFAEAPEDVGRITPSLRKLVLAWRVPLHLELRRGGFVFAPVALRADPASLSWLLEAAQLFPDKAAKL